LDSIPTFTEEQCRKALDRLTIYAQRKFARLGWQHNGIYESPRGHKPEEIAAEAIVKVIDGTRIYNARKCPDLLQFLRGVVKSIISHITDSSDFKRRKAMPCIITRLRREMDKHLQNRGLEYKQ